MVYANNYTLIKSVCEYNANMCQQCIDEIIKIVVSMSTYDEKTAEVLKDYIIQRNVWNS